jgi:hypothetical protein
MEDIEEKVENDDLESDDDDDDEGEGEGEAGKGQGKSFSKLDGEGLLNVFDLIYCPFYSLSCTHLFIFLVVW